MLIRNRVNENKNAVLIPEEISLLISSNPNQGATNRSADGSTFTIQLQESLHLPADAKNVNIEVQSATVWWVVPNITTGVNDKIYCTVPRASDSKLTAYTLTIPQGLYDLTALNQTVQRELENAGAIITPEPAFIILADDATQKVEIRANYVGVEIDFTQADTPRDILGWTSVVVGPSVSAPQNFLAPSVAQFNQVNSFLICSDLVNRGMSFNGKYNQIISQVLIDVSPGSQIVYTPFHPPKLAAQDLAGNNRTSLRFWLTDDQNRLVNTNGEYYTVRINISYLHPHFI